MSNGAIRLLIPILFFSFVLLLFLRSLSLLHFSLLRFSLVRIFSLFRIFFSFALAFYGAAAWIYPDESAIHHLQKRWNMPFFAVPQPNTSKMTFAYRKCMRVPDEFHPKIAFNWGYDFLPCMMSECMQAFNIISYIKISLSTFIRDFWRFSASLLLSEVVFFSFCPSLIRHTIRITV